VASPGFVAPKTATNDSATAPGYTLSWCVPATNAS